MRCREHRRSDWRPCRSSFPHLARPDRAGIDIATGTPSAGELSPTFRMIESSSHSAKSNRSSPRRRSHSPSPSSSSIAWSGRSKNAPRSGCSNHSRYRSPDETHSRAAAVRRQERWQRIALQAAEQSRRPAPAEIASPVKLSQLAELNATCRIVLSESEKTRPCAMQCNPGQPMHSRHRPRGGWTADELQWFRDSG